MARLKVAATLLSQSLFRGADKCPVICGASWDGVAECVVLDIFGAGVPEVENVSAVFTQRTPLTVEFQPIPETTET